MVFFAYTRYRRTQKTSNFASMGKKKSKANNTLQTQLNSANAEIQRLQDVIKKQQDEIAYLKQLHKESKEKQSESSLTHSAFDVLSVDLLKEILAYLQDNEHSFFAGLVCKAWDSLISRKHFSTEKITNFYASQGNLSCLKWIHAHNYYIDDGLYIFAARFARNDILQWALDIGLPRHQLTTAAAADRGHFETLKWLHTNNFPLTSYTNLRACSGGHVNILEWLATQKCTVDRFDFPVFSEAAKGGHLNVLQYLHQQYNSYPGGITEAAAQGGQLHILKWALEEKIEWGPWTFHYAVRNGNVQILQWLKDNQLCTTDSKIILWHFELPLVHWLIKNNLFKDNYIQLWRYAASHGHLDTLQLFDRNLEYMSCIYSSAAFAGHLHILKWAHEKGVPELDDIVANAASGGHLHILKWTKEIGIFEPSSKISSEAAKNGDLEMLKWAVQNGCGMQDVTVKAAKMGHLNILKWAFANGENYRYFLLCKAAVNGHTCTVKWLVDNYALQEVLSDPHICLSAASEGSLGVLKYLRQIGCQWDSKLICEMNSRPSVSKWLMENNCPCNGSNCNFHIKQLTIETWYKKFFEE